jgi:hypothetical protein
MTVVMAIAAAALWQGPMPDLAELHGSTMGVPGRPFTLP